MKNISRLLREDLEESIETLQHFLDTYEYHFPKVDVERLEKVLKSMKAVHYAVTHQGRVGKRPSGKDIKDDQD